MPCIVYPRLTAYQRQRGGNKSIIQITRITQGLLRQAQEGISQEQGIVEPLVDNAGTVFVSMQVVLICLISLCAESPPETYTRH